MNAASMTDASTKVKRSRTCALRSVVAAKVSDLDFVFTWSEILEK